MSATLCGAARLPACADSAEWKVSDEPGFSSRAGTCGGRAELLGGSELMSHAVSNGET